MESASGGSVHARSYPILFDWLFGCLERRFLSKRNAEIVCFIVFFRVNPVAVRCRNGRRTKYSSETRVAGLLDLPRYISHVCFPDPICDRQDRSGRLSFDSHGRFSDCRDMGVPRPAGTQYLRRSTFDCKPGQSCDLIAQFALYGAFKPLRLQPVG